MPSTAHPATLPAPQPDLKFSTPLPLAALDAALLAALADAKHAKRRASRPPLPWTDDADDLNPAFSVDAAKSKKDRKKRGLFRRLFGPAPVPPRPAEPVAARAQVEAAGREKVVGSDKGGGGLKGHQVVVPSGGQEKVDFEVRIHRASIGSSLFSGDGGDDDDGLQGFAFPHVPERVPQPVPTVEEIILGSPSSPLKAARRGTILLDGEPLRPLRPTFATRATDAAPLAPRHPKTANPKASAIALAPHPTPIDLTVTHNKAGTFPFPSHISPRAAPPPSSLRHLAPILTIDPSCTGSTYHPAFTSPPSSTSLSFAPDAGVLTRDSPTDATGGRASADSFVVVLDEAFHLGAKGIEIDLIDGEELHSACGAGRQSADMGRFLGGVGMGVGASPPVLEVSLPGRFLDEGWAQMWRGDSKM